MTRPGRPSGQRARAAMVLRVVVPTVRCLTAAMALCLAAACGPVHPVAQGAAPVRHPDRARTADPTVVAVGDISPPTLADQQATSDLALHLDPTRVLVLGDEQYPAGGIRDFRRYYDPTWGRLRARTHPAPGNHEYATRGAAGYFRYFGAAARPRGRSWYSVHLGGWHLISLNSNVARGRGSPQLTWLRRDLAATRQPCVLAFWHHPRFSSGVRHGSDASVAEFWTALYARHADVVLNGHEHNYEAFAPQDPSERAAANGIREFVAGTGGNGHYPFGPPKPQSVKRIGDTYGVLELVLHPTSYSWRFVAVGGEVLDRGGPEQCHRS